jgi:hypothetical protein
MSVKKLFKLDGRVALITGQTLAVDGALGIV